MDMNGGHLSMEGIDVLRTMETNLSSCCEHQENMYNNRQPCEIYLTFWNRNIVWRGEYVKFNPTDVFRLMIKGYKLEDESKLRSIQINQAIDGAQITTRTHHTTIGFKMADKAARDPRTGDMIYANKNKSILLPKNHCFPTMIVMTRETTAL